MENDSVFSDVQYFKKNAEYVAHPGGYIVIGGQEVANTLQCCHCGMHWVVVNGSGKIRGYCGHCKRPTCGDPKCHECIPYEAVLEFQEGKYNNFFDKIKDKIIKFGGI